ncbi:DUF3445 domain-containing protein [Falsigemmobacter faecalis]|uniref:DUF3445 domain-containing protein n=2 Tax=Falsigemmobacter faecalis TaxID=2488730 RepID=A0A3P3DFL4_9RHOB|nr:DUF3445 domain-containing protein [Falsigemmobacter faecalis]
MPWMDPVGAKLPGIRPLDPEAWIFQDEAFTGQMRQRDALIRTRPAEIHALLPEAAESARELLSETLILLLKNAAYSVESDRIIRPDGEAVEIDFTAPLLTLGRLVQEDFVLHLPEGREHVMKAAILCFPASWSLSEKIGRPLTGIHRPVKEYDENLALRVQRLFDAIRPGQPLWRSNALLYEDPALFQPRREGEVRPKPLSRNYLRSERQALLRLPQTKAVVFSIHTSILHVDRVPPEALAAFRALHP